MEQIGESANISRQMMRRSDIWTGIRENFGLSWLALVSIISFVILLFRPMGLHYRAFVGAALAFWQEAPMYAVYFPNGADGYLYSPSCAAFFYSLFAYFPNDIGRAIYIALGLGILAHSILYLRSTFHQTFGEALDRNNAGQLLWIAMSSEINGAILAEKLEIYILAVFLYGVALLWKRRYVLPVVLLAIVASFKFQSLPVLGLLFIVLLRAREWVKPLIATLATLLVLFAAPFLFQSSEYISAQIGVWNARLPEFMRQAWMADVFHHVYGFAHKTCGLPVSYDVAQMFSAGFGAFFAAIVVWQVWLRRERLELGYATAYGLGAAFVVMFSPLSQGTGYLLYFPLPLLLLVQRREYSGSEKQLFWILLAGYFFASLCVSDLMIQPFRRWFYMHAFKVVGPTILLGYFLKMEWARKREMSTRLA